jgi:hypothetical protein
MRAADRENTLTTPVPILIFFVKARRYAVVEKDSNPQASGTQKWPKPKLSASCANVAIFRTVVPCQEKVTPKSLIESILDQKSRLWKQEGREGGGEKKTPKAQ